MKVKQNISNLLGGISLSAPWKRRSNQLGSQINALPSTTRGLSKRPPFDKLLTVSDAFAPYPFGNSSIEVLDYGDGNVFYLILAAGSEIVEIVDAGGTRKSISYPVGKGYLVSSGQKNYRSVTVGRRTYFLNPEIEVASGPPTKDTGTKHQALIWVRENDEDATAYFAVNLVKSGTNVLGTYSVGDDPPSDIAAGLATDLETNDTGGEYEITHRGSLIHVKRTDGESFTVSDWSSSTPLQVFTHQQGAETMGDLPTEDVPPGFIMAVTGNPTTGADDFYVEWDGDRWNERVAPGDGYRIDWQTMPHELVYDPDADDFTFQQIDWVEREAGDSETNPEPSFVGETINEIFFIEGRLGLISGNNISLSRAGEPEAFFRKTVRALRDNAPIDVESTAYGASYFHSAIPWNERIYLFTTKGQYILSGEPVLSPRTIQVLQVSNYSTHPDFRPQVSGGKVFLMSDQNGTAKVVTWSHPEEHPASGVDLTRDVSSLVKDPVGYTMDDSLGFLAIASENIGGTTIWVYFYDVSPDGSLYFSNWGQWQLPAFNQIRDIAMVDGRLLVLTDDSDLSETRLLQLDVRSAMTTHKSGGNAAVETLDMVLELTPIYLRDENDEAETKGRLVVQFIDILFDEHATDVTLTVERPGREVQTISYSYSPGDTPGPNALRVPIRAVGPDTKLSLTGNGCLTGIYWEGMYHTRHRRI